MSTTTSTYSPATSTYSDLFPTSSSTSDSGNGDSTSGSHTGPNVYYLVFLGVLVVLMFVAACLAYRALRMRRRYRTATQLAIARGERLPEGLRDDYWGLGGLSGWTAEGLDRLGAIRPGDESRRDQWRSKWARMPVLYEAELEKGGADANGDIWQSVAPLTVLSRRRAETTDPSAEPGYGLPDTTNPRNMGPRPRPPPIFNFSRYRSQSGHSEHHAQTEEEKNAELNRPVQSGEPLMMAVVIQMPTNTSRALPDDPDDRVAWEPGMELGVWEGHIAHESQEGVPWQPTHDPISRSSHSH